MEAIVQFAATEAAEELKNCIICNAEVSVGQAKKVRSGTTLIGYRCSDCPIPQWIKDKYPAAR